MALKKVVHLTSVHPPFDTRIFHKECRSLVEAGYDVVLIAPHDRNTSVDGIRIVGVRKAKTRLGRLLMLSQLYRAALSQGADVYHFHDPELVPIALLLKHRGARVVFDVHEDIPKDILTKHYLPLLSRHPIAFIARIVVLLGATACDAVVTATPAIAKSFPRSKTVVVQNFPLLSEGLREERPYTIRPPHFAYIGVIAKGRGACEMIRAMGLLPPSLNACLVMAGTFVPEALPQELRALEGWARVRYMGMLSRAEVWELLGTVRAGLVLFHPEPNHVDSQPNKLFEYMAAGIPVVASNFPLWREIVVGTGSGIVIDPYDVSGIAAGMQWLLAHPDEAEAMGRRGREAVLSRYNWDSEKAKLLRLYDALGRT